MKRLTTLEHELNPSEKYTVYIVKNSGVLGKKAFKYGISEVTELVKRSKG